MKTMFSFGDITIYLRDLHFNERFDDGLFWDLAIWNGNKSKMYIQCGRNPQMFKIKS